MDKGCQWRALIRWKRIEAARVRVEVEVRDEAFTVGNLYGVVDLARLFIDNASNVER